MDDKQRDRLTGEIYNVTFTLLDDLEDLDGNDAGAIATVAEKAAGLVLSDRPLMIAPRLPDDRERNRVTLMAAIELGAQYVLQVANVFYFFATEANLDARLATLGLPAFSAPDQPTNTPTGPYGALREDNLHWHT